MSAVCGVKIFRVPCRGPGALRGFQALIDQAVQQGSKPVAVIEDTEAKRCVSKDMRDLAFRRWGRFFTPRPIATAMADRASAPLARPLMAWVNLLANAQARPEGCVGAASTTWLNAALAKACCPACAMLGGVLAGVLGHTACDALGGDPEPSPLGAEVALAMVSNESNGVAHV